MARAGAFDDVDAAMMVHPAGVDLVTMPSLALAEVDVTYTGEAAHASAMPERGINALDALVTAYNTIAQLRQHIRATATGQIDRPTRMTLYLSPGDIQSPKVFQEFCLSFRQSRH